MNPFRFVASLGLAWLACAPFAHAADPLATVTPRPLAGPYPVACSDVAQDFSRLPPGDSAEPTWEGFPRNGSPRYITDLLTEPADTLIATFRAPDNALLFGPWRDQTVTYVLLVCYPTSPSNTRPNYPLPNGKVVPRMQRAGEGPILPDDSRWPVVAFSHGYGGSPLSNAYIDALAIFASHGYVVVAPFHGDPRYAVLSFDSPELIVDAISNFERYTAMQATRPLSVSAALDVLLSHPQWRDHVDPNRIGGFGASQGGETLMLLGGAELTTSIFLSSARVTKDDRIKAAVGYVPYFGQRLLPAFGRDNRGTEDVTLPYLAISGTSDTTAPIGQVEDAMRRLNSTRELVALIGVQHGFDAQGAGDIFTWSLTWLDALVKDDRTMRAQLTRMEQVAGGRDDAIRVDYIAPATPAGDERNVVEYYNEGLDHFFVTADPNELGVLDRGEKPGWQRTGLEFKSWTSSSGQPVCRFFGVSPRGGGSHFYTVDANECQIVKGNSDWLFEGLVLQVSPASVDVCPSDRVVVWRLYNNGMRGQANHRYTTSHSEIGRMLASGWLLEGPVFCTPP